MTVVAFVRLMPNPPALVEIRKTWYATARVSARGRGELKTAYAIFLAGTGGTVTTCRADEGGRYLPTEYQGFASADLLTHPTGHRESFEVP